MIKGYATIEGTKKYQEEIAELVRPVFNGRYTYSGLGLGTFIGDFSDEVAMLFRETIEYAILNGVNFIDTAINYRGMRSERDIGIVLTKLIEEGKIERNQVVIASKAGIIPGDGELMLRPIYYMQRNLLEPGLLKEEDTYMEGTLWLTMHPAYYHYAVDVSRKHMNLETIDIYYMHELELSMRHFGSDEFYRRLEDVIVAYEQMVSEGKIREYGMATWDAFQLDESHEQYISLERVMEIAEKVSPNHHFKHLMIPINVQSRGAVEKKNQMFKGEKCSILECAIGYGLEVHASGSLGQGDASTPESVEQYLHYLVKESGCESFFTGTKQIGHLKESIEICKNA